MELRSTGANACFHALSVELGHFFCHSSSFFPLYTGSLLFSYYLLALSVYAGQRVAGEVVPHRVTRYHSTSVYFLPTFPALALAWLVLARPPNLGLRLESLSWKSSFALSTALLKSQEHDAVRQGIQPLEVLSKQAILQHIRSIFKTYNFSSHIYTTNIIRRTFDIVSIHSQ